MYWFDIWINVDFENAANSQRQFSWCKFFAFYFHPESRWRKVYLLICWCSEIHCVFCSTCKPGNLHEHLHLSWTCKKLSILSWTFFSWFILQTVKFFPTNSIKVHLIFIVFIFLFCLLAQISAHWTSRIGQASITQKCSIRFPKNWTKDIQGNPEGY